MFLKPLPASFPCAGGYEVLASFCRPVRPGLVDPVTPSTGQGRFPERGSLFPGSLQKVPAAGFQPSPLLACSSSKLGDFGLGVTNFTRPPAEQPGSHGCFLARLWAGSTAVTPTGPAAAWEVLGFVYKWRCSQLSAVHSWSVPTICHLFRPLELFWQ